LADTRLLCRSDGRFRLVALPGRGMVAAGPNYGYLTAVNADRIKGVRTDGVSPAYPHACFAGDYNTLIEINPDRQTLVALDVVIELDPGRTLPGTVLGPDGKPLAGAHGNRLAHHGHTGHWEQMPLETAQFTVNGLAPGKKRRLVFVHEQRKLAGT